MGLVPLPTPSRVPDKVTGPLPRATREAELGSPAQGSCKSRNPALGSTEAACPLSCGRTPWALGWGQADRA